MKLAIASGKGGTGKTMVAANLAFTLSRTEQVTLVDCDVEEPNLHLFFPTTATTNGNYRTGAGYRRKHLPALWTMRGVLPVSAR